MTSWRPYWCPKTTKRRPCWCPKPILWELNSFLMQTLSFVPINLNRCWPCEWKHSIGVSALRAIRVTNKLWESRIIKVIEKTANVGLYHVHKSCFTCRLPFITSTKKLTVSLSYCASFIYSFPILRNCQIESGVYGERKENKSESRIPPISIRFSFLSYPQGIYCSQAWLTTHTPKTRSIVSFWPKQNR